MHLSSSPYILKTMREILLQKDKFRFLISAGLFLFICGFSSPPDEREQKAIPSENEIKKSVCQGTNGKVTTSTRSIPFFEQKIEVEYDDSICDLTLQYKLFFLPTHGRASSKASIKVNMFRKLTGTKYELVHEEHTDTTSTVKLKHKDCNAFYLVYRINSIVVSAIYSGSAGPVENLDKLIRKKLDVVRETKW